MRPQDVTAKSDAMDWDDLRYLLTIARGGTLAAAARRLGVDQTTVARRLAAAEASLGARLFERVDGVLHPTKAGAAAIARAAQVEAQVNALESGIGSDDAAPAGLVRLTAVPILINRLIIPALPSFAAAYPRIQLELIAEPRNVSLSRREADIALRLSRPERGGATLTRRIGRLDYAAYGPRGCAAERLPWIGYEDGLRHLPQARWIASATDGGKTAPLLVNDAEAILQAIHAGLGKSLLPCRIADRDQRLKRLAPEVVLSREAWLLTHNEVRHHGRIAAVIAWLQDLFAR
jgi:DNA-binding transcriptional LysR family regulator